MDALTGNVKPMMAGVTVLIVDDEYCTRKVIRTLLLAMGCTRIHEASDGASGLDAVRAFAPDIVLLDWEMPGVDGATFVRRLRSGSGATPQVPIIMLTGHDEHSRVLEAVRLGVHSFLLKPVSMAALQARMVAVLSKPRAGGKAGEYCGPERRKLAGDRREATGERSDTTPEVDRPSPRMLSLG